MFKQLVIGTGIGFAITTLTALWSRYYTRGRQVALRDRLRKADAIVTVAGTRGKVEVLDSKIRTAVQLYQHGWAPLLIFTGKFSAAVNDTPQRMPVEELALAVAQGRLEPPDLQRAAATWDVRLGAHYMKEQAVKLGVPVVAIITEGEALHTLENAKFTASILRQRQATRIILITSPFHQLRTFLAFRTVLQNDHIEIINYYADTKDWHPTTWFLAKKNRQLVYAHTPQLAHKARGSKDYQSCAVSRSPGSDPVVLLPASLYLIVTTSSKLSRCDLFIRRIMSGYARPARPSSIWR